jgi:ribosomal protein S18 acetylase RimI-like enzyme
MFIIQQANLNHLEPLADLFNQYRMFYQQADDLPAAQAFLKERIENRESVVYIALTENSKQAAGFVHLYPSFSSVSVKRLWILNDLFVAPAFRKQGVAKLLMNQAKELAIQTASKGLSLSTAVDNHAAQQLYESLGYERDNEFYQYFLPV